MQSNREFFLFLRHSIPRTIWAIGISSLLINTATAAIFSGSALYLKTVIGVSVAVIGYLEAVVEAVAYGIRIFAGVISDYLRRRKVLMIVGFVLIALSKPILALSKSYIEVFTARTIDRIGNGLQASPREALVSDSAPKESKGACFGLRQSLAVIGSTLGGLLGIIVMKITDNDFNCLFWIAAIPSTIAIVILILFVKEHVKTEEEKTKRRNIRFADLKLLGQKFWILMIVVVVFMLGRFSEIFISLHACGNFGLNIAYGTVITMIYNFVSTVVSYPIGKMSDSRGRLNLLLFGFATLLSAHLLMGFAINISMIICGTITWGIQRGISEGLFSTLVSDYVPKDLRGTGFGVYYFVVSISTAIASALAGKISHLAGEQWAFKMGIITSIVAILLFLICKKRLN
ncbi:MAG: MFS transporter [Holosporales bacterium]|jgi:MFS family permease|nr:MFS transporter [Holosporales bacterium]